MKKSKILVFLLALAMLFNIAPISIVSAENLNNNIELTLDSSENLVLNHLLSDEIRDSISDGNVEIKNISVKYIDSETSQANKQIGYFSGTKGTQENDILEFDNGVALSTGDLKSDLDYNRYNSDPVSLVLPNTGFHSDKIGTENVNDAASISFDIILKDGAFSSGEDSKEMILQYAFASEEYTQYSKSKYNDRLGVIINGKNYAKVPGTDEPIAIKTINQVVNTEFFRKNTDDNDDSIPDLNLNINLNGLTKTFTSSVKLNKGKNTVKFIIGDYGDSAYDSVLFIKEKSLKFKKFEPGKLSVEKGTGNNIIIKRLKDDGSDATDGTISFTLVQEDLEGNKTETVYTIPDSKSELTLPISSDPNYDGKDQVLETTAKILIKDAKMGATVDQDKNKFTLKIPSPILSKDPSNEKNIKIKGLPSASVTLTKKGGGNKTVVLDGSGNLVVSVNENSLGEGDYTAKQTLNALTSLDSNLIKISYTKPPIISGNKGAFDEIYIDKGQSFDIAGLGVSARKSDAQNTPIPKGTNFIVENPLAQNTSTPGIYTIKWTAKDAGFTVVKTKTVKVRPDKPVMSKDFKNSVISVSGSSNDVVKIYNKNGDLIATVPLDASGKGKFIDPPNGEYYAVQTVNGVESKATNSIEIERKDTVPVIKFSDNSILTVEKGKTLKIDTKNATASDAEDDDAELTKKIKIYSQIDSNSNKVTGEGKTEITLNPSDTNTVGIKEFYYSVTDTDGNSIIKIKYVHILPKSPTLSKGVDKLTVNDIEPNALVKLYKQNDDGSWVLFDSKIATGTNPVDFSILDTGVYKATQVVKNLESSDSNSKGFANPAFLNTKIVKDNEAKDDVIPLEGVKVEITEVDGSLKKASSLNNGSVLFGVESTGRNYEMKIFEGGNTLFANGKSSEIENTFHTKTTVIGAIETDGMSTKIPADKIIAKLQKEEGGNFVETTTAKVVYRDGVYQLNNLEENKKYRVILSYDYEQNGKLAITEFEAVSGENGSIKVLDNSLKYGKITDEKGRALSGVSVTVYRPDRNKKPDYSIGAINLPSINVLKGGNKNGSLTDAKGEYGYSVYNAQPYVLVAKKNGYKDKIIFVESVKGNLLGEDIQMVSDSNSSNNSNTSTDSKEDKPESPKTDKVNPKKDGESRPTDNSGISIIEDVPVKSLVDGAKKTSDGYENNDVIEDGSYSAYKSGSNSDEILEEPKKGTLFINPESGDMIYIPAKTEEGKDSFVIDTKDKDGKKIKLKKNLDIKKQTGKIFGRRTSLVLELSSPDRRGFEGTDFDFSAKFKNNLDKDVKNATIAVKIPKGFEQVGNKYKVKKGHLIIPVKDLNRGMTSSVDFKLKAVSPKVEISRVNAVLQDNESPRIHPEAVSSLDVNVLKQNTKYYAKPYVNGYPNGDFERKDSITRAEVAAMLTRCLNNEGKELKNQKNISFNDVNALAWYSKYIKEAVNFELFDGFSDGSFKPDKFITRAELARVVSNYLRLDISEAGTISNPYSDVDVHWARDDIHALRRYGISIGYKDGTFKPKENISREETVKIINNMLYRYKLPEVKSSFGDLNDKVWSFGDIESAYRGYSFEMDSSDNKLNIEAMN